MGNLVVIPARLGSTRLPRKPLLDVRGDALIVHTVRSAFAATRAGRVVVATDSEEIAGVVRAAGFEAVMTRDDHPTGTDRVAEVAGATDAERVVNVQGDEPFIEPGLIDTIFNELESSGAPMVTAVHRHEGTDGLDDPAVVKVATDRDGRALYFSRSPIPFHRDEAATGYLRHVGIYGFRRDYLLGYSALPAGDLEGAEKLEQLRALENGDEIRCVTTAYEGFSVDTPEDYEEFLRRAEA